MREPPVRYAYGWELKRYAITHSPFQEVLFLDADNVPVVDPTYLFDQPDYPACSVSLDLYTALNAMGC